LADIVESETVEGTTTLLAASLLALATSTRGRSVVLGLFTIRLVDLLLGLALGLLLV